MNEQLKVIISAEIKKLQDAVGKAKKSISEFTKQAKEKVQKFGDEFSKVGDAAKKGLAVVGGAVAGAAAALVSLSASTAEYRTAQAKLNTAFETAGASAGTAQKVYNDLFRVLGDTDTATEASALLAQLTTDEEKLSQYTEVLKGVYASFPDSLPTEALIEACNETAKTGQVTGNLADALNWTTMSSEEWKKAFEGHPKALKQFENALKRGETAEDAFNAALTKCNTEAEREQVIRQALTGLYGDAAAEYEKNNASLLAYNEAQAKMAEASAKVGEALQPVMTALTTLGADILTALSPYIEKFAAEYLPKITEALAGVGEKIGEVISWIADNWELVSTIGTIILGIVGTLAALSAAISVVSAVLAIVTSPITLVVLGIAALVAAVVLCIKYWDEIKAKVKEVVDAIVGWVTDMAGKVGEWFSSIKEKMTTAISEAKEAVSNKFEEIKTNISDKVSSAKEAVVNKFSEIKQGMSDKITEAKTAITSTVSGIIDNFRSKFTTAKTTVLGIFDSIKSGLTDKINAAKDAVGSVIETIKGFFDFKFTLPSIPKPSFGITPSGWKLGDLLEGVIPKLSINWNATGGVFDKPSIVPYGNTLQGLGEAGAEAIVPLEKTKWIDVLADKLAAREGNKPIVLMVDGKVFAQTTIDSINQLTRQTGSLALNIV